MAKRTTKPGSRSDFIVRLIGEIAAERGRGLDTGEIREAYEERTRRPAPRSLTSEVHSLKRRGILEITGGRAGRLHCRAEHAALLAQEERQRLLTIA